MKPNIGQGDSGKTSLLGGGVKVPKDSAQVEAYGSLDELVSFVGYIRASHTSLHRSGLCSECGFLTKVQDHLFRIESHVSASPEWERHQALPYVGEEHIKFLEDTIERYEKDVPPLSNFILPGGTELAALLHIARAQSRCVERRLVALSREKNLHPYVIPYLNRLSDVFFALARWANHQAGVEEEKWVGVGKKGV